MLHCVLVSGNGSRLNSVKHAVDLAILRSHYLAVTTHSCKLCGNLNADQSSTDFCDRERYLQLFTQYMLF